MACINNQQKNSSKNSEPVGYIKFNDYPKDLQNGELFLSKESTFMYQDPPIGDPFEGFLLNKKVPITSYKDILSCYSKNSESYISCFTALYENDFENDGYIKKDTVDRLKKLDSNNKERTAVLFPEGVITLCFYKLLCIFFYLRQKKLDQKSKEYYAMEKIYNLDELDDFDNFDNVTIKADLIQYIDMQVEESRTLCKDDKEKLEKWKPSDNDLSLFEKYLYKCFFEKPKKNGKYRYDIQNEYKVVLTIFATEKIKMPENIKLKLDFSHEGIKIFKHNELNKISKSDVKYHPTCGAGGKLKSAELIYK